MTKKILIVLLGCIATWASVYFVRKYRQQLQPARNTVTNTTTAPNAWNNAAERVKAARDPSMIAAPLIIPPELRHYSERYWFLATQVAEIEKYKVHTCQDFLDLATAIQRGEFVAVSAVTETYVLFGVGQKANDAEFTRFEEKLEPDEAPKIDAGSVQRLARDNEALQTLAKSFAGRSYDLNAPFDRYELRLSMLCSLRPEALKILEEVAATYHRQFNLPLPISSLIRPEQYQHALNRVNRNAVLIDSPPHSTGLAFDIDYRYMTAAEQTFLMAELARIKNEGRIEVIRERNANYHVFVFLHGTRPSDDLITASLEKARPPGKEAPPAKEKKRSSKRRRR